MFYNHSNEVYFIAHFTPPDFTQKTILRKNLVFIFLIEKSHCLKNSFIYNQVAKVCPKDKDAQKKFTECKKLVHQQAFAKAIEVDDTKVSIVESLDLESMCMLNPLFFLKKANLKFL